MRGIIQELRHRNVFRVGIAYVIAGWLLAQVVDLAADAFKAPDWIMQMLIIVLLIGLPIALFLAWAYELTPEGVKKAEDVPLDAPKDPRSGQALNRVTTIALIAAVAWIGWDALQERAGETTAPVAAVIDRSIAVLPFADFSPDADQSWFADGLTEEILNSLARTADLHVASRTSSFAYKGSGESIPDIAKALNVAHILEGSVRRAGDQLRVTAQLIRAADDKHLWSETFDGSIANSLTIQEEIAIQIAKALQTAMDPAELAKMMSSGTSSVEAWELYLQALALQNEAFERVDSTKQLEAAAVFDQAVAIDPDFVDAHNQLVAIWFLQLDSTTTAYSDLGPAYEERRARFDAALEASIRLARSDVERLRTEYRRAVVDVRVNEALRIAEELAALQPGDFDAFRLLSDLYQQSGQRDKAREAALRAWSLPLEPGDFRGGVITQMRRIDVDEAVRMVDERLDGARAGGEELTPNFYYQSHRALLDAGQIERAAGLIDSYALRSEDSDGKAIVRIRQACAEGRVSDADAIFESFDSAESIRWLILMTLGRVDEARELLRQYDTPEKLFILAAHLNYRTFDPRDYPLLWKTLQSQDFTRPPVRLQTFACKR